MRMKIKEACQWGSGGFLRQKPAHHQEYYSYTFGGCVQCLCHSRSLSLQSIILSTTIYAGSWCAVLSLANGTQRLNSNTGESDRARLPLRRVQPADASDTNESRLPLRRVQPENATDTSDIEAALHRVQPAIALDTNESRLP